MMRMMWLNNNGYLALCPNFCCCQCQKINWLSRQASRTTKINCFILCYRNNLYAQPPSVTRTQYKLRSIQRGSAIVPHRGAVVHIGPDHNLTKTYLAKIDTTVEHNHVILFVYLLSSLFISDHYTEAKWTKTAEIDAREKYEFQGMREVSSREDSYRASWAGWRSDWTSTSGYMCFESPLFDQFVPSRNVIWSTVHVHSTTRNPQLYCKDKKQTNGRRGAHMSIEIQSNRSSMCPISSKRP